MMMTRMKIMVMMIMMSDNVDNDDVIISTNINIGLGHNLTHIFVVLFSHLFFVFIKLCPCFAINFYLYATVLY